MKMNNFKKNILLLFLIINSLFLYAKGNTNKRDQIIGLMKGFQKSRESFLYNSSSKKELIKLDLMIIRNLNILDFSDAEDVLSGLLDNIITYNAKIDTNVSLKAIKVYYEKFKNKKYFVDFSLNFLYLYGITYPYEVARIFDGYTYLLNDTVNINLVLNRLSIALNSIENEYLIKRRRYAREVVISALAKFFTKYMQLVKSKDIIEDPNDKEASERRNIIMRECSLMELNRISSMYKNLDGIDDLKKAYYNYGAK